MVKRLDVKDEEEAECTDNGADYIMLIQENNPREWCEGLVGKDVVEKKRKGSSGKRTGIK